MKIVQLCPYAMARPGGVQRHVHDLSAWLSARGHEVRIIAPPAPGTRPRTRGNLIELGHARSFGTHGTAFELARAGRAELAGVIADLRDWGGELVHMHTPWTPMLVWQIWRRLRLPTVTTIHATLPERRRLSLIDGYIRWSARRLISKSNAIVVPSRAPLAMLETLVPNLSADILPPAVDLADWRAAPDTRRPDAISVVFLGRLEARKGIDVLLDAWPAVARALPDAVLTIAGDGAMRDRVIAAQNPQLRHLERPDDATARKLLAGGDIFVAPAPYGESYGIVLAEAMSAGAVPVAAANPGYASVLGTERPELLAIPGDAASMAEKITALAKDREHLRALRDWAIERARLTDISNVGPKYETLFASVLAQGRRD